MPPPRSRHPHHRGSRLAGRARPASRDAARLPRSPTARPSSTALDVDEADLAARAARGTTPRPDLDRRHRRRPLDRAHGRLHPGCHDRARCSSASTSRPTTAATRPASRAAARCGRAVGARVRRHAAARGARGQPPRAIRFYEKLGFTLTGRSREYELAPGGLELEMIKPLR